MVVKKCTSCTSGTFDSAGLLSNASEFIKRWEIEGHQLERKQYCIKPVQAWSLRQKGDFRGVPVKAKAMAEAGRVEEAPAPPTSNWPNQGFFTFHILGNYFLTCNTCCFFRCASISCTDDRLSLTD